MFRQYWRIWIDATTRQIVDIQVDGNADTALYGGSNAVWRDVVARAFAIVTEDNTAVAVDDDDRARRLKVLLDSVPTSYDVLLFSVSLFRFLLYFCLYFPNTQLYSIIL